MNGPVLPEVQPDYHLMEGPDEWSIPSIIAGLWVEGDDEDRDWIDSLQRTARWRSAREFEADHYRSVFGGTPTVW